MEKNEGIFHRLTDLRIVKKKKQISENIIIF